MRIFLYFESKFLSSDSVAKSATKKLRFSETEFDIITFERIRSGDFHSSDLFCQICLFAYAKGFIMVEATR